VKIGIVGHAADKFAPETEARAKTVIRELLSPEDAVLVSGHCHLGGVDIWAEEIADELGRKKEIFAPAEKNWADGYKPRNIRIAKTCDELHNIVVADYPPGYNGMIFKQCYHCFDSNNRHVKSGGCWTANLAKKLGKKAVWHVIGEEE
jgi:hypothetical protein